MQITHSERLRRARLERIGQLIYGENWSSALARRLGHHRSYFNTLERQGTPLPADLEARLASVVGEEITDLRRRADGLEKALDELGKTT